MNRRFSLVLLTVLSCATGASSQTVAFELESASGLVPNGVTVTPASHEGKRGIRIVEESMGRADAIVLLPYAKFRNGTIEVELAGDVRSDASEEMRGFVGIAFRVSDVDGAFHYECIYLRPTNGRADEQLRRNHSVQYVSHPEYTWRRLRDEYPGVYESYADLVPGEWTQVRIVVTGRRAELFLHGGGQPVLIVRDLKGEVDRGGVALWIGQGTVAHFRDLRITPESGS